MKLVIRTTAKYGNGVFARDNIKRGSVIHVLSGVRLSSNDLVTRVISGEEYIDDPLQVGRKTYLDLDELSRTFNHSCDPNAGLRKRSELFTIRDIRKGEEITYDCSSTIAPTEWAMTCKCGSTKCRKTLGDVMSIPKEQLEEYKKAGALQDYMKVLPKEIEAKGRYELPKYEVLAIKRLNEHSQRLQSRNAHAQR